MMQLACNYAAGYATVLTHFLPGLGEPFAAIERFPWDWLSDHAAPRVLNLEYGGTGPQ